MDIFLTCIFIFFARICDVSLGTIRTIMVVRGKTIISALLGFVEILIWYFVVRQALTNEFNLPIALCYAGGYASGVLVGGLVERGLALGQVSVNVIIKEESARLVDILRKEGYGVSVVDCQGINGKNLLLLIGLDRKKIKNLKKIIMNTEPNAFITVSDTRSVLNGHFN